MPQNFKDQPWYSEWRKALDRVIEAQMAKDRTEAGTREREAAEREYEAAFADFRKLANEVR